MYLPNLLKKKLRTSKTHRRVKIKNGANKFNICVCMNIYILYIYFDII